MADAAAALALAKSNLAEGKHEEALASAEEAVAGLLGPRKLFHTRFLHVAGGL